MVDQQKLEAAWREAWRLAEVATFYETLDGKLVSAGALVAGGSLSSISRNAASHSYAFGSGNITPSQIQDVALEALRLYESLQSELAVERDDAGELAIYNEGLARFAAAGDGFDIRHDFSCYRA